MSLSEIFGIRPGTVTRRRLLLSGLLASTCAAWGQSTGDLATGGLATGGLATGGGSRAPGRVFAGRAGAGIVVRNGWVLLEGDR